MSNSVLRIFPRYHTPKYSDEQVLGAVEILKLYSTESITFTNFKSVQFISCGEGLEHIFCPWCGAEVERNFWQESMDKAYVNHSFKYLGIAMPCCKFSSSLEELIYVNPCGFATFVIEIDNPSVIPCVVELHEMGKCFGYVNFFRMISAHW